MSERRTTERIERELDAAQQRVADLSKELAEARLAALKTDIRVGSRVRLVGSGAGGVEYIVWQLQFYGRHDVALKGAKIRLNGQPSAKQVFIGMLDDAELVEEKK